MRRIFLWLLILLPASRLLAQPQKIEPKLFFADTTMLEVTVETNIKQLLGRKLKEGLLFPAVFKMTLPDGTEIREPIQLEVRGHFRRETCYIPPLKLRFKNEKAPFLSPLKSLKLVNPCDKKTAYNEYLLKEYLIYKIYNLLTDMSFRARLLHITYVDNASQKVFLTSHSFLLEDLDDLAKRNGCREVKRNLPHSESTNRNMAGLVYVFQYMIGNTDWSIPVQHNIKFIGPREDTTGAPFPIPYDFDHAGFVDAGYALPNEMLPISSVTERLYRGFPRSMEELEQIAHVFNDKQQAIYDLIGNFELLPENSRKNLINYLKPFFQTLNDPRRVRMEFINSARSY